MDLADFITDTLTAIMNGIVQAQGQLGGTDAVICPDSTGGANDLYFHGQASGPRRLEPVEFDVSIVVESGTEAGGKGAVRVAGLQLGGGAHRAQRSETTHRLKFSIPVALPRSADGRHPKDFASSMVWSGNSDLSLEGA